MICEIVKSKTTLSFRTEVRKAIRNLKAEYRIQSFHRASLKRLKRLSLDLPIKLNLGCGANNKKGWINIDLSEKADLQLDLREKLPFADESVAIIYSEHFFDYLDYPNQALKFLKDSFRVLVPGGTFSLSLADTEWPLMAYATGDDEYFRIAKEVWHPDWCKTRLEHVNQHIRCDGLRKYAYDFETLTKILAKAGFISIKKRPFNQSLDIEIRRIGSLYVDARKPDF